MIDFAACRNLNAEHIGASVFVSAMRCEMHGVAGEYAGLSGIVSEIDSEIGEVRVLLDERSHKRYCAIETSQYLGFFLDVNVEPWFCSGVLEVVT